MSEKKIDRRKISGISRKPEEKKHKISFYLGLKPSEIQTLKNLANSQGIKINNIESKEALKVYRKIIRELIHGVNKKNV